MSLADDLHDAMEALYRNAGEATGYWGRRFIQAVRKRGGLAWAHESLKPRKTGEHSGLKALFEAGRPDLSLEALVLESRFAKLFSAAELAEAQRRLDGYKAKATKAVATRERLYPDELPLGQTFPVGAKRQVRVNAYERDPRARRACLALFGYKCAACDVDFATVYGDIGKNFIHVHHIVPISKVVEGYAIDPAKDLVPVCPNCHAMLHRTALPLSIKELKQRLRRAAS